MTNIQQPTKSWPARNLHALLMLYIIPFYAWFHYLEENAKPVIWVKSSLDNLIPFHELFVIPYFFWYFYVPAAVVYFFFKSKRDYLRLCGFMFTGMTICLILYTLFPNGQLLRLHTFERQNFFVDVVRSLRGVDTPTNVCPSIHCLNAIAVHIAVVKSELGKKSLLRFASFAVMVSVCASTVALKQHSIIDVAAAILLATSLYFVFYYVPQRRVIFRSQPVGL